MSSHELGIPTHSRFLDAGPMEGHIKEFVSGLTGIGYTALTIGGYLGSALHFAAWAQRAGIAVADIDDPAVAAFAVHRCACPGGHRNGRVSRRYVARVAVFVDYMRRLGVVNSATETPQRPLQPSLLQFCDWLRDHRGLSEHKIKRYSGAIEKVQPALSVKIAQCDAATVRDAVLAEARRHSCAHAHCVVTALRAYLRFLAARGQCRPGLDQAVPAVPQWKLSALPRYLLADDVERVIASCDPRHRHGIRDRAVLLLLARLGLRGGDIVNLRFDALDWHEGTLRVLGKGRREIRLPLPQDAGDALLAYIEDARPAVPIDRVFLCAQAPHRPFATSASVSDIVRTALLRAGIADPPSRGANLLRHSAATTMLRAGATLDVISTVLRHRSSDTTAHYAKVDVTMLREIAQPWPEYSPC